MLVRDTAGVPTRPRMVVDQPTPGGEHLPVTSINGLQVNMLQQTPKFFLRQMSVFPSFQLQVVLAPIDFRPQ